MVLIRTRTREPETDPIRRVPIVNNPEVTETLSNCTLCLCPIGKVLGAWVALNWAGAPIPGTTCCSWAPTAALQLHSPEPPLTWAERWDAVVHL